MQVPRHVPRLIRSRLLHLVSATTILGALLIATSLYAFAQSSEGEISGLTLTSQEAGTLVVTWDAPSPAPNDYRVNWAKASEDFPSYRDNHGNEYPTTNGFTITGLDQGVEYKVKVKVRYRDENGKMVRQTP